MLVLFLLFPVLDKLGKNKTFMLQKLSFQTFFYFRFLRNEPLIVCESDLLIMGFRVW